MKITFYSTLVILSMTFLSWNNTAFACEAAETKKVCVDKIDKAGNKPIKECKTIKVHKKLDTETKPAK
jgi:hypothetical protein